MLTPAEGQCLGNNTLSPKEQESVKHPRKEHQTTDNSYVQAILDGGNQALIEHTNIVLNHGMERLLGNSRNLRKMSNLAFSMLNINCWPKESKPKMQYYRSCTKP